MEELRIRFANRFRRAIVVKPFSSLVPIGDFVMQIRNKNCIVSKVK